ncbi:hypothetical protein ACJX0J_015944 [Zea mays]
MFIIETEIWIQVVLLVHQIKASLIAAKGVPIVMDETIGLILIVTQNLPFQDRMMTFTQNTATKSTVIYNDINGYFWRCHHIFVTTLFQRVQRNPILSEVFVFLGKEK